MLICLHYLRHITRHFLRTFISMDVLERDNPWDFRVKLSNGSEFNIEIISIADNKKQFINNKSEERLSRLASEKSIRLHELEKLTNLFPNEEVSQVIDKHKTSVTTPDEFVANPHYPPKNKIVVSCMYEPEEDLAELLKTAINKKISKLHIDKENTVLLIDNRAGAFDVAEYYDALAKIGPLIEQCPFAEIWFYTGYYSDDDGNNAEFSFSPIKVRTEQKAILDEMKHKADEQGVLYW